MQLRYRENFSAPDLTGNSLPQKHAWEAGLGPHSGRVLGSIVDSRRCGTELSAGRGSRVGDPPHRAARVSPKAMKDETHAGQNCGTSPSFPPSGVHAPPWTSVPKWGRDFEYDRISLLELGEGFLFGGFWGFFGRGGFFR